MYRIICIILAISICGSVVAADSQKEFNYQNVVEIAAIKEDKFALFVNPEIVTVLRDTIANSIERIEPVATIPQAIITKLLFVGMDGTSTTIIMGDHWVSDGTGISILSTNEFSTIMRFVNVGEFDNDASMLTELTVDYNLAKYRDGLTGETSEKALNDTSGIVTGDEFSASSFSESKVADNEVALRTIETSSSMHSTSANSSQRHERQSSSVAITPAVFEITSSSTNSFAGLDRETGSHTDVANDYGIDVLDVFIITLLVGLLLVFLWRRWR